MVSSHSYDDEESDESESSSSENSQDSLALLDPPTDYFYSLETQHKDFVRSMVQFQDNILITASEDKTMKVFYFQF